jgi:hypothetical protein
LGLGVGEQLEAVVAHAVTGRAPAEQELAMLALAAVDGAPASRVSRSRSKL